MIELPRRSVTRFFIPLIDVLILLVCIFLLLPFVSRPDATGDPATGTDPAELAKRLREAEDRLKLRDEEVRRLMDERAKAAERTAVRVLEIDADTGELFHYTQDGPRPERVRVANAAQAQLLIDRTRQTADGKQAYFLLLYPRTRSRFPTEPQVAAYADWFRGVPHQFDNPFAAR